MVNKHNNIYIWVDPVYRIQVHNFIIFYLTNLSSLKWFCTNYLEWIWYIIYFIVRYTSSKKNECFLDRKVNKSIVANNIIDKYLQI